MITVVYGPPGSGKTRNSAALARHFRARRVLDGWSLRWAGCSEAWGGTPPMDGDLLLTTEAPPFAIGAHAICAVPIEQVLIAIGKRN